MARPLSPVEGDGRGGQMPSAPILGLLVALLVVRLAVAAGAGLTEDEAYYRLWALAPAFGYLDHAPFVAWAMAAGRALLGDTELGLRLFAPVSAFLGSLAIHALGVRLGGRRVGAFAVLFLNAGLLVAAGGVILTPDAPLVLFWGLTLLAAAEAARGDGRWWLAVGVAAGLALLSKYTAFFLGAGLVLFLVVTPELRRAFADWRLWAGGAVALALFAPVLQWNAAHEWASFVKQMGRAERLEGRNPLFVAEFLGGFVALANPFVVLLAAVGLKEQIARTAAGPLAPARHLLWATSLPFALYLLWHALSGRVQPNWPAPLLPALALAAAFAVEGAARWRRPAAIAAVALGLGLSALLYLHAVRPLVTLAGTRDPTHEMRGFAELGREVERIATAEGAAWIATWSYATTAQLAWALRDRPLGARIVQVRERLRYAHLPPPDPAVIAGPALFVDLDRRNPTARWQGRFETAVPLATLDRKLGDTVLQRYVVVRLGRPLGAPFSD